MCHTETRTTRHTNFSLNFSIISFFIIHNCQGPASLSTCKLNASSYFDSILLYVFKINRKYREKSEFQKLFQTN